MISTNNPELLLRALRGPGILCLMALMLSDGSAKVSWLRWATGLGEHSLTTGLNDLKLLGLASHGKNHSDWQLNPALGKTVLERVGCQLHLGECADDTPPFVLSSGEGDVPEIGTEVDGEEPPQTSEGSANRGARAALEPPQTGGGSANLGAQIASELPQTSEGSANRGAQAALEPPQTDEGSANHGATLPDLERQLESVVVNNINNLTTTTTTDSDASIKCILAASEMLFGERIHGPSSLYPDARLLLATLAEIYDHRGEVRKPARVVYTNLKNGWSPPEKYLRAPLAYLPREFLAACGLALPGIADERDDLTMDTTNFYADAQEWVDTRELLEDSPEADEAPLHPSLDTIVNGGIDGGNIIPRSAASAWRAAIQSLRNWMPRSVYVDHIENLALSRYEEEPCCFVAEVGDEFERSWLEQRFSRTLESALTGYCARQAQVRFVPCQHK